MHCSSPRNLKDVDVQFVEDESFNPIIESNTACLKGLYKTQMGLPLKQSLTAGPPTRNRLEPMSQRPHFFQSPTPSLSMDMGDNEEEPESSQKSKDQI